MITNRKYTNNKKNDLKYGKGNVPIAKDKRTLLVPVGCGKCMECRKQKANQWKVRMMEDIRVNKNAKFITLTFSEHELGKIDREIKGLSGYERDNEITRIAVRRFTERWRKKYKKTIRHWLVTELGHNGTERIHMHGLVWTDEKIKEIRKIWKYGRVVEGDGKGVSYVNEKSIGYIVKYISKADEKHKEYKSKVYASKGLGKGYIKRRNAELNVYKSKDTDTTYRTRTGHKIGLPVYYRNKLYNEEQREALWLEMLDKEERWVDGVRIDVSKNDDEYYKKLDEARKKSKRLGYADNSENWEQKKYEIERRNIIRMQRIKKLYEATLERGGGKKTVKI
jgi:hypothetical protein